MKYIIVPTNAGFMIKCDGQPGYLAWVYRKDFAERIVSMFNSTDESIEKLKIRCVTKDELLKVEAKP